MRNLLAFVGLLVLACAFDARSGDAKPNDSASLGQGSAAFSPQFSSGRPAAAISAALTPADFSIVCGAGGPQVLANCEFKNTSGQAATWCFSDYDALGGGHLCTYPSAPLVTYKRWMQMGGVLAPGSYLTTITAIVGTDTVSKQVSCTKTKCAEKK